MDIYINDNKIDFALNGEKTVADVKLAMDKLLASHQQVTIGLTADGDAGAAALAKPVEEIAELRFEVADVANLVVDSLVEANDYLGKVINTLTRIGEQEEGQQLIETDLVRSGLTEGLVMISRVLQNATVLLRVDQPSLRDKMAALRGLNDALAQAATREDARNIALRQVGPLAGDLRSVIADLLLACKTTAAGQEAVRQQLARFRQELPALKERLLEIAIGLQSGKEFKALQGFQEETLKLQEFISFLQQVQQVTGADFSTLQTDAGSMAERIKEFLENLKKIVDTFANQDFVLLADLLEYELSPFIDFWVGTLDIIATILPAEERAPSDEGR